MNLRPSRRELLATAASSSLLLSSAACSGIGNLVSGASGQIPRTPFEEPPFRYFQNLDEKRVREVVGKARRLKASNHSPEEEERFKSELVTSRWPLRLVDDSGRAVIEGNGAFTWGAEDVVLLSMTGKPGSGGMEGHEMLRDALAPPSGVTAPGKENPKIQACLVSGTKLENSPYTLIGNYADGLSVVDDPGSRRRGYIDAQGKFKIAPRFARAYTFSGGFASAAEVEGKWGVIDTSGKFVLEPKYRSLTREHGGWMLYETATDRGIVSLKGQEIGAPSGNPVRWLSEELAIIHGSRMWFGGGMTWPVLLTKSGKKTTLTGFEATYRMPVGFAGKKTGEETFRWYDADLKLFHDKPMDVIAAGYGDAAPVSEGGKWGLLTAERKWRVPPKYASIGGFEYGLATFRAEEGDRRGFLTPDGQEIEIPDMAFGNCMGGFLYVTHKMKDPGFYTRRGQLIEMVNLIRL